MEWYECVLPLRHPFTIDKESYQDMEDAMYVQTEDELLGEDWLDSWSTVKQCSIWVQSVFFSAIFAECFWNEQMLFLKLTQLFSSMRFKL